MRTLWAKWLKVAPWLALVAMVTLLLPTGMIPGWLWTVAFFAALPAFLTVFYLNDLSFRDSIYKRGYEDGKAEKRDDQGNS